MIVARALFAAPAAAGALAPGRAGVVELVLSKGAYVRLGVDWLMLAGTDAAFGPLSLAIDGLDRLELAPGQTARTLPGRLELGAREVSLARMRERGMVSPARPSTVGARAAEAAAAAVIAALPAAPPCLTAGIAALAEGRVAAGVRALAGLGEGLTPAGDDVLAGYAAATALAARAIPGPSRPAVLEGTGPISTLADGRASALGLAYLRCAERLELPDVGMRLLAAVARGSVPDALTSLPALGEWGASSGIALGWGIAAAFGVAGAN